MTSQALARLSMPPRDSKPRGMLAGTGGDPGVFWSSIPRSLPGAQKAFSAWSRLFTFFGQEKAS
jgi:hypothetical protein